MFELILLNLIITVVAYLAVPAIFCLRGEKMTRQQINKISLINGCCVCFAFIVLRAVLEVKGGSGAVALWTPIGHWIMSKRLLISDDDSKSNVDKKNGANSNIERVNQNRKVNVDIQKTNSMSFKVRNSQEICFCRKCGNRLVADSMFCNKCGVKIDRF